MPFRNRSIRFFISSTFADMEPERNAITSIMTKLHAEYSLTGWSVDYIDLRWGVSKETSADNKTMRTCLEELRRCKKLSPRPNFLFLIGDRYGWLPYPETIYPQKWNKLFQIASPSEKIILTNIYKLDSNCLPEGIYLLQRKPALIEFLTNLFSRFYGINWYSATEQEINEGVFKVEDAAEHVVGYIREMNLVPENLKNIYNGQQPDDARRVGRLKKNLKDTLPPENILDRGVISFSTYKDERYIKWFEEEMEARIRRVIEREIQKNSLSTSEYLRNYYFDLAKRNSKYFFGREKELSDLMAYITSQEKQFPLLIAGEPGLGKTSFMSKAIVKSLTLPDYVIIPRFLGSGDGIFDFTGLVVSIFNALHPYFSPEGKERYPHPIDRYEAEAIKNNNVKDENWFHLLDNLLLPGKYILFLDAIDRIINLKNDNCEITFLNCFITDFHRNPYSNFPAIYNKYEKLRIIGSYAMERERIHNYDIQRFHTLKLNPFNTTDKYSLIKGLLASRGRGLSQSQSNALINTLKNSETRGIYLDVIGKYIGSLTSYQEIKSIPCSFKGATKMILDSLLESGSHNRTLLKRFLAVIATATDGIDIISLNGTLACDKNLVNELIENSFHDFNIEKSRGMLPPILLSRLYSDLDGLFISTIPSLIGDAIIIRHQETLKVVKEWLGPEELKYARKLQYLYFRNAWKEPNLFAINEIARLSSEILDKESATFELASLFSNVDYLANRLNISGKQELMNDFNSFILLCEEFDSLRPLIPNFRKFAALLYSLPDRVERDTFLSWCYNLPFECSINKKLIKDCPDNLMIDYLRDFDFSKAIEGTCYCNQPYNKFDPPHFALRYSYRVESGEKRTAVIRKDLTNQSEEEVLITKLGKDECMLYPFSLQNILVLVAPNSIFCYDLITGKELFRQGFTYQISLYNHAVSISETGRYVMANAHIDGGEKSLLILIDLSRKNPIRSIPKGIDARFSRSENFLWVINDMNSIMRWDLAIGKGIEFKYTDPRYPAPKTPYPYFAITDALDDKMTFARQYVAQKIQYHYELFELNGVSYKCIELPGNGYFSPDEDSLYVAPINNYIDLLSLKGGKVRQCPFVLDRISLLYKEALFVPTHLGNGLYNFKTVLSENLHYFPIDYELACSGFSVAKDAHTICISNFQTNLKKCIVIYKYEFEKGWHKKLLATHLSQPSMGIQASCISPSGEVVAYAGIGDNQCRIQIIRISDNQLLRDIIVPNPIGTMRFSTDGKTLVTADANHKIAYNHHTNKLQFRIIRFQYGYDSLYTVKEITIPTIGNKGKITGYWSFDLLADNRRVIFDGIIFDLLEGRVLNNIPLPMPNYYYKFYSNNLANKEIHLFTKDGLIIGSGKGEIIIFDVNSELSMSAKCEDTPIALSPDGCCMIMRTPDCKLYRTDLSLSYKNTMKGKMPENVINVIFHPVKKAFYAITRDSGIYFCNMEGEILAYALAVEIIDAKTLIEGLVVLRQGAQVSVFSPSLAILNSLPSWEFDDTLMSIQFRNIYFKR